MKTAPMVYILLGVMLILSGVNNYRMKQEFLTLKEHISQLAVTDIKISREDNRMDILDYVEKFDMIYLTMMTIIVNTNSTAIDKMDAIDLAHKNMTDQIALARKEINK